MIALLFAGATAFGLAIFGTPVAIRWLREREIGQFIREEVEGHYHKQGTPTMGGVVMIGAAVAGYLLAHLRVWDPSAGLQLALRPFHPGGLLVLTALVGMGAIGLLDDYAKVRNRRSLGLSKRAKFGGQIAVAAFLAWAAVQTGASTDLSFTRPLGVELGPLYGVWVLLLLTATANAVNITDGMDGLASGSAALVFGAYMIIGFWQFRHPEFYPDMPFAFELSVAATALLGAALGFLWWNAAPARIIMGDVGSQALGGAVAALALLSNTHLLLLVIGGLFVAETVTVILQVISFRMFGRRIFRMAPFHHHFELSGWPETTVVVRFWILAAIGVAVGLGIFYGDFIARGGVG